MVSAGLLGCGNIGHIIAKLRGDIEICALFDVLHERADMLAQITNGTAYRDFSELLTSDCSLIIEAASVEAVHMFAKEVLLNGKDLVIMSVGALSDEIFYRELLELAHLKGRKIYIPSGAIFGLDNLKVGMISRIDSVLLKTTKGPGSLKLDSDDKKLIFKGKARECIKGFPKNMNVSVALGLACGIEPDVELWVDPAAEKNVHEIFVSGEFGEAYIKVQNNPSPDNPSTSYLAALSVITLLTQIDSPIIIGT